MKNFPDLPPIWLLGCLMMSAALARGLPWPQVGGVVHWAGTVLIVLAIALIVWCAFFFWRKATPIEPHHRPRALIVEGPYRLSRNPIYLALVVIALGFALRQGALSALLPIPLLFYVLDRRFAAVEEAALRDTFGEGARAYLRQTRRWV